MAHTKAGGTTKLGRDSAGQRLGVKRHDGVKVNAGTILVRQRGTQYIPGTGARRGGDDTLFATATGQVKYEKKNRVSFSGSRQRKTIVSVVS